MTKIGIGTLTLAGTNFYNGGTTVGAGVLAVASTSALPGYNLASKVAVGASGTLTVLVGRNGWTASNINSLVGSNGSSFAAGRRSGIDTTSATSNFSYGNLFSGNMGFDEVWSQRPDLHRLERLHRRDEHHRWNIATRDGDKWERRVAFRHWRHHRQCCAVYDLYGSQTYSGVISGTGSLSKLGAGALTLSNSSAFSGATTISGGSLVLGSGNALQSSTVTAPTAGNIVFANSGGYTFGGLNGSGNLSLQSGSGAVALNVGGNATSTLYSGNLTGSGSLTKAGGGTLTLTGSNAFSGGVTITGGMLTVASSGAHAGKRPKPLYWLQQSSKHDDPG